MKISKLSGYIKPDCHYPAAPSASFLFFPPLSRDRPPVGPERPASPGQTEYPLSPDAQRGAGEPAPRPSPEALRADFRLAINRVLQGDCVAIMRCFPAESVDLAIADPPYLVSYRERAGRRVTNDSITSGDWLEPSTREIFRILRPDSCFISFYGWPQVDRFMAAWKQAGFRPVSHLVWTKDYPSTTGYTAGHHEVAYLLAKGRPRRPTGPPPDANPWKDTRNRFHPTQKSVEVIRPLIRAFSQQAGLVIDPFAGSGSTAVSAVREGRRFIAIEQDPEYCRIAERRLELLRVADPPASR